METKQPIWKFVANLGDVHPIDHGGYFVFVDETGVYPPEAEYLESPDDDNGEWRIYRFILEPCTYINGVLSDNKYHPDKSAWFAKKFNPDRPQDGKGGLIELASFTGQTTLDIICDLCSDDPCKRAFAWRIIGEYHGLENLDGYPLIIKSRSEVEARYKDHPYASVN